MQVRVVQEVQRPNGSPIPVWVSLSSFSFDVRSNGDEVDSSGLNKSKTGPSPRFICCSIDLFVLRDWHRRSKDHVIQSGLFDV